VYTILLLTEEPLTEHDAARVAALHGDEPLEVHVLVPADTEHNALVEALDEVALGRLRDALVDSEDASPEQAQRDAMHAVNSSVAILQAAGLRARGSVTGDDPVPAAMEAVSRFDVDEILVVTPPHLVREALHRDWASRLRDKLKLPLLHFVAGTDRVVG
jgi:hypothetical protein